MSNKNIYDIIISEEVARQDGNGSNISGGPQLVVTIDAATSVPVNDPLQDPITVTSTVKNMPLGWEVDVASHIIEIVTYANPPIFSTPSSNATAVYVDITGSTIPPPAPGQVKQYSSQITLLETGTTNVVVLNSIPVTILAVASLFYGFSNIPPTNTGLLTPTINTTFNVASNGVAQNFYISIPDTQVQPVAIRDEHGLVSNILDYPIQVGLIADYITYMYQWPIKLTGNYTHTFTLIYS